MLIGKRISFSLDGVWTEWGFRWHATRAYQRSFSRVWLISLGSNSGTPLYLNPHARVNTIFDSFPATAHATRDSDVCETHRATAMRTSVPRTAVQAKARVQGLDRLRSV